MTNEEFDLLIHGQMVVIKEPNQKRIVTIFDAFNFVGKRAYSHLGVTHYPEAFQNPTKRDVEILIRNENNRHQKALDEIESSFWVAMENKRLTKRILKEKKQ